MTDGHLRRAARLTRVAVFLLIERLPELGPIGCQSGDWGAEEAEGHAEHACKTEDVEKDPRRRPGHRGPLACRHLLPGAGSVNDSTPDHHFSRNPDALAHAWPSGTASTP